MEKPFHRRHKKNEKLFVVLVSILFLVFFSFCYIISFQL